MTVANNNKPLWTCPRCGKKFVTRNMWHSCGRFTVDKFFQGKSPRAKELYEAFSAFVRKGCGLFIVDVAKTRIAFQTRTRFAGVHGVSKGTIVIGFWLKRKIESPRFTSVSHPARNDFVYKLRIASESDLDAELLKWLKEAYSVGEQKYRI